MGDGLPSTILGCFPNWPAGEPEAAQPIGKRSELRAEVLNSLGLSFLIYTTEKFNNYSLSSFAPGLSRVLACESLAQKKSSWLLGR